MFYYKKLVPEIDEIVVCRINKISDAGIYVKLLEYNDIEGYVPLKELTTNKYRKMSGIIKENDIEYIKVINIDKNYIDLSRKYIDEDEKVPVQNRYNLLKRIYKIMEYSKLDNEIIKEYTEHIKEISENVTKEKLIELNFDEIIINKIFPEEIPKIQKYNLNVLKFIKDFLYINSVINLFKTIESECNIKINICNIKNGEILIISNERIKEKELENLKNNVTLHLQNYKESFTEENKEIILNKSVGIQPTINIGIIGSVSHGKTTVIEALSGIDTRKYKKEIESNRTLKLGYTNISVTKCVCENQYLIKKGINCTEECKERIFSFIDCFDPSTKVFMNDFKVKFVSELKVGDLLMGPDGTDRKILNIQEGEKTMYEINYVHSSTQSLEDNKFICTGGHLLVLRIDTPYDTPQKPSKTNKNPYQVVQYNKSIIRHYFNTKEDAQNFYNEQDKTPFIFEITVEEYLKLPITLKTKARLFHPESLDFSHKNPIDISMNGLTNEEVGWLIGLWLGDGHSNGPRFSIGFVDQEIIDKLKTIAKKLNLNLNISKCGDKKAYDIGLSLYRTANNKTKNPFTKLLEKIGILNNKKIDNNLIFQSKSIREAILAGFIDSDGYYSNGQFEITQSYDHKNIISGLLILIRSIGFTCHYTKKYSYKLDKFNKKIIKDGNYIKNLHYRLKFNGKASLLPIVSIRKKGKDTVRNWVSSQPFTVKKLNEGKYRGFELDKDNKFLLSDFIVVHNCPGHNMLLSTMLCGASIMDTTMLIISANETCPQLQTKEHLIAMEIANDNFEGNHNIIIQNKIDIINKEKALNSYNEINTFIKGTSIENSQIYPISAKKKINTQSILKHIYNLQFDKTELNNSQLKAIIVRNFDINKPGNNELKGLVLGCSILSGKIKIGDTILIMPQCIKIRILNIKTGNDNLNEAVSGGLIALETDANSFLINSNLIGSMLISNKDFNEKNFYKSGSEMILKCYPLKKSLFKKDDTITLNILSKEIPNCIILDVYKTSKCKYKIKLSTDIYLPNDTNIKISILYNKRLYGYGKFSEIKIKENNYKITTNQFDNSSDIRDTLYNNMLNESYQILKDNKVKLSLPKISIEYKNTFTQIFNFNTISNSINVSQLDLGNYIKTELGMRDFSIKTDILSLKGRTNINNIQTIIIKYIKEEKLCPCCGSINTEHVKIMNVKKLKCLDC